MVAAAISLTCVGKVVSILDIHTQFPDILLAFISMPRSLLPSMLSVSSDRLVNEVFWLNYRISSSCLVRSGINN